MNPELALIGCIVLVAVLLSIERKRNPEASYALWIPTIWILIAGSRPIAQWFDASIIISGRYDEIGNPLDRFVLGLIIILALLILYSRKIKWSGILKDNFWLILIYLYLALSILWSDLPFVSFKRWVRLLGLFPIALIILSERLPFEALESVFRRCAYILIPFSLVLIKYFQKLGVDYGEYSGQLMWVGVSGQKNGLGMICAISSFFLIWATYRSWKSGELLKNKSQTFADIMILGIALFLLRGPEGAYSATSIFVMIMGLFFMLILYRKGNITKWIVDHLKAVVVALPFFYLLFKDTVLPYVLTMLGRDESLTGRTDIWELVLDIASLNPLLGVGYGAFWGLQTEIHAKFGVQQAHNGYLGVYLEIGIVGILVLFAFLLEICGKGRREINHAFEWGVFVICFLLMTLLWNYSEDSFLKTSLLWTYTVFIAVVLSSSCVYQNDD